LLLALVALGGLAALRLAGASWNPAAVRDALRRLEEATGLPIAPAVLIALLVSVLIAPAIPASVLQVGSGLAFGPAWGLVYVLVADALGAALGFVLARRWGPRTLRRWLKPATVGNVERLAARLDWKGVVLLRLLPGPAYPLVSFAAGLSRLPLAKYLLASLLGALPSLALLVYAGDVATGSPLLAVALVVALVASLTLVGRLIGGTKRET
jgi:uncharacterized membrane protein YdjX (TVP38/TMEM64 family)